MDSKQIPSPTASFRNILPVLSLFFISFISNAQVEFENGYLIDNNGGRSEVLIKNLGWLDNPEGFEYKRNPSSTPEQGKLEEIREFGVPGKFKFVKARVGIDRAKQDFENLNKDRNPQLQEETVFLKVLIEGKGTLYSYRDEGLDRYFYSVGEADIAPLIYKKYIVEANKVGENNRFRQQLFNELKCKTLTPGDFNRLNYNRGNFVRLFRSYNKCMGSDFTDYLKKENSVDLFDLRIKAGAGLRNTEITQTGHYSTDFGPDLLLQAGMELEFTFPFLRNKWSLMFEPTLYHYKTKGEATFVGFTPPPSNPGGYSNHLGLDVTYSALSLPLGFRHHFFFQKQSEIFVNAGFSYDLVFSKVDVYRLPEYKIDFPNSTNYFFGLGYSYRRLSGELRYSAALAQDEPWQARSSGLTLNLGYRIF